MWPEVFRALEFTARRSWRSKTAANHRHPARSQIEWSRMATDPPIKLGYIRQRMESYRSGVWLVVAFLFGALATYGAVVLLERPSDFKDLQNRIANLEGYVRK